MMKQIRRIATAVTEFDWLILLLMLPAVWLITPQRLPILLIIPLLIALRRIATGHFVPRTPLDWPLLLMLIMVAVSLYATFDIVFSLGKVVGLVHGIALFYALADWGKASKKRLIWMTVGFISAGIAVGIVGLLGSNHAVSNKIPGMQKIASLLPRGLITLPAGGGVNPNEIGGVMTWIAPLALVLAGLTLWNLLKRRQTFILKAGWLIFAMAGALLSTSILLLTQSRSSALGLIAAILFLLMVALYRFRGLFWGIIALMMVACVVFWVQREQVTTWIAQANETSDPTNSLESRVEIWSRAFYGLEDFPFTGMGMNTFRRVVPILYPLFLLTSETDISHAHNHLLQAGLDLGFAGLIAYISVWVGSGLMLFQAWRGTTDRDLRALVLGLGASLVAHFVYGMTDTIALGARPGFLFWALLALVAAVHALVIGVKKKETASFE